MPPYVTRLQHSLTQNEHKFNTIRLHFSHQAVLKNEPIEVDADSEMKDWNAIPYIGMLVEFAEKASDLGILIVLASSRLSDNAKPGSPTEGLWYNDEVTEDDVLDSWTALAKMFCDHWNVVGIDLFNEPWAAAWGHAGPIQHRRGHGGAGRGAPAGLGT